MRIISGTHRGRRIQAPKNISARPTTDLAKEALFNILNNTYYWNECEVLDLYAGTGNISFEFASRGCTQITAVDNDARSAAFIKKMAITLQFPIEVFKSDVCRFLGKTKQDFDIIFADPPYSLSHENFAQIPTLVFEKDLLKDDGLLIIEHSKHTDLSGLEYFSESRKYGGSVFSFFSK
ncbi:MAG: 16S rRNA (guanine(966)-N(2))-methyltransferase RsmD [Flavobacteriaceae bacterium]